VLVVREISRADANVTQTVCCSGLTVTKTFEPDGGWWLTADGGSGWSVVVTGSFAIRGDSIQFSFDDPSIAGYIAWVRITGPTMTQRAATLWDSGQDGDLEAAIEEVGLSKRPSASAVSPAA
jgi:hypothetical protein